MDHVASDISKEKKRQLVTWLSRRRNGAVRGERWPLCDWSAARRSRQEAHEADAAAGAVADGAGRHEGARGGDRHAVCEVERAEEILEQRAHDAEGRIGRAGRGE